MLSNIRTKRLFLITLFIAGLSYAMSDVMGYLLPLRQLLLSPVSVPLAVLNLNIASWLDGESGGITALIVRIFVFCIEFAIIYLLTNQYLKTKNKKYLVILLIVFAYIVLIIFMAYCALYGNKPER